MSRFWIRRMLAVAERTVAVVSALLTLLVPR
jgi:hypothetical protein